MLLTSLFSMLVLLDMRTAATAAWCSRCKLQATWRCVSSSNLLLLHLPRRKRRLAWPSGYIRMTCSTCIMLTVHQDQAMGREQLGLLKEHIQGTVGQTITGEACMA